VSHGKILLGFACVVVAVWAAGDVPPVEVGVFGQEVATLYTEAQGLPSNDVLLVGFGKDGSLYASTAKGLVKFAGDHWEGALSPSPDNASVHQVYMNQVDRRIEAIVLPSKRVGNGEFNDLMMRENDFYIATDTGLYVEPLKKPRTALLEGTAVHQLAVGYEGVVVAADSGLYIVIKGGDLKRMAVKDESGRDWGTAQMFGVVFDSAGQLWFASKAGVGCRGKDEWRFYTGAEGLPCNAFTCAAAGGDGAVWFGTEKGAIRFDGNEWAYRQGRAWLPDDAVRKIAVDKDGTAWFATSGGVGCISRKPMTLMEKAEFYEQELERYIKRTEYGYVSEVFLEKPGDKSKVIYQDSDNDGLWTSMYGAGECFAYGATKEARFKERAQKVFEALRFLQVVTQGCEHSPPKGYVARTIRSVEDPDPNVGRLESDRNVQATGDRLWKVYEPRWPKSADGKWYWKSDTSSDELDGHYFFYPAYYDLVAETQEEKARVREVVRDLTDHLIEHNYALVDHDGTPTRWGVYSPDALNHDPNWWYERGLKSLSMLSYLAVAEHVTGDAKYGAAARDLIDKHGYQANAMFPKFQFGHGSGNQSDDEMAVMCFYNLVKYTKDPVLKEMILFSFYCRWALEEPEMNPFFNFAYAAVGLNAASENVYGAFSLKPWEGWLADSVRTLTGFPLDRVAWGRTNSHRLDIVRLPRLQAAEPHDPPVQGRGYRHNGKVLPVEERFFGHWNTDPYALDYRGRGLELCSGTVYLLPYYMGLYHGFIR